MKTSYRYFIALFSFIVISFDLSAQSERFNVDSIKSLVHQLSSDTGQVKAFIDMAAVIYCEDSNNKIIIANEAKKLAEKINWHDGLYKANRKIGDIYFTCMKNYPKAFAALGENVTLAQKFNDTLNESIALETIAKFYQKLSQHTKALEYYNKVLALRPDINMQIGVLADEGVVWKIIGDYNNALISYKISLNKLDSFANSKHGRDIQDTLQRAGLLLNIGDIYLTMSNPDKAYEYYEKVWKLTVSIKDIYFQIASLTGFGKTFKLKHNYQKAIENYQLALFKCREINEFREEVKILDELANTYLDTYVYPKALAYSDTSLRLAEDQSYVDLLPKSYITLGNIYIKQNMYDLAIPSLQKALSIAQTNRDLDDEKNAWFALYKAYKSSGKHMEGLDAYEHFISTRDSLYNIDKENEFTKNSLEFEFKKKQEIDSLSQARIYDSTIDRQKRFTYTGFAGLLLVVALAFFIYRNYNIQKKYNELLSREKKSHLAHIEAQSNVLSDIAHTQAHHVRGPIATILGLIQLFNFEDPADPVNKEVIEGLAVVTDKLDKVVKDVIIKENKLRYGKDEERTES
ncbi:MAG: Tfp pilus assembly protein PilF [Flavipsychrobacter sp.]|nr:Tfp pilus assembly protein PilF [Flavipsychrobacter sp.]